VKASSREFLEQLTRGTESAQAKESAAGTAKEMRQIFNFPRFSLPSLDNATVSSSVAMNVVKYARLFFVAAALLAAAPRPACAQTDEIQVYDASIAPQGKFNLTWHNNFTPDGMKTAAFPGGIIPDRSDARLCSLHSARISSGQYRPRGYSQAEWLRRAEDHRRLASNAR
jgi:hypothetical protein